MSKIVSRRDRVAGGVAQIRTKIKGQEEEKEEQETVKRVCGYTPPAVSAGWRESDAGNTPLDKALVTCQSSMIIVSSERVVPMRQSSGATSKAPSMRESTTSK